MFEGSKARNVAIDDRRGKFGKRQMMMSSDGIEDLRICQNLQGNCSEERVQGPFQRNVSVQEDAGSGDGQEDERSKEIGAPMNARLQKK
jgi:hypothetical protein